MVVCARFVVLEKCILFATSRKPRTRWFGVIQIANAPRKCQLITSTAGTDIQAILIFDINVQLNLWLGNFKSVVNTPLLAGIFEYQKCTRKSTQLPSLICFVIPNLIKRIYLSIERHTPASVNSTFTSKPWNDLLDLLTDKSIVSYVCSF